MQDAAIEEIRRSPYFVILSFSEFERVIANTTLIDSDTGDLLIAEGDSSPELLVVLHGAVKVTKSASDGREQILRIARRFDSLNDVPAFDGGPCPATAVALEPSRIACVSAAVFRELLHTSSALTDQLLQTYVKRLRAVTELAGDLTLLDATSRVAKTLNTYTRAAGSNEFELRQEQLAGIVGTKRETVSRALRVLEDRGAIERKGHSVCIRSRVKLRQAAAEPTHPGVSRD